MKKRILAIILSFTLIISGITLPNATKSEAKTVSQEANVTVTADAIYGNGLSLLITEGTKQGTTSVYVDKDGNGQVGASDTVVKENEDLSQFSIYGDGEDTYDSVSIKMTGGTIGALYGCGGTAKEEEAKVLGNATIIVTGGTVKGDLYGVSGDNAVNGNLNVNITGGKFEGFSSPIDAGSDTGKAAVSGSAIATISGATFTGNVLLAGTSTVGSANITVNNVTLATGSRVRIVKNMVSKGDITIDVSNTSFLNTTWDLPSTDSASVKGQFTLYVNEGCDINANDINTLRSWGNGFRVKNGGGVLIDFYGSMDIVHGLTIKGHFVFSYGNYTLRRN